MGTHKHSETHRYAAFISYAHADEAMAARLHKALETYPVPRHLRAQGKTTKPVFRDIAELTAAHSLSEKIREAVKGSRVLIVLCSPAAKASHWVNEEIRLFRELHGDAAILSAIIDGTPETAFPDALVEGGREPLAAALGADKAGFKLGVTQLAAGMLGTGLDDLVQRGAKRRQKIMGAGLAASLALSGVMGFATLQAVEARKEAESARGDAEGLVEYMIKDLKFKLEPVGRLDLLEGIGDKAVEYYDKQDIRQLPDDSLTRQAAARQVLAQVHLDAGRMEEAQREIEASADLTREVLVRNPDDTDAIFAHAQSEFWVADYFRRQGKHAEMEHPLREYDRLAQSLYKTDPTNFDWVMEAAWGKNNLGVWARESGRVLYKREAKQHYDSAISFFKKARKLRPDARGPVSELSDSLSGRSFIELAEGNAKDARAFQKQQIKLSENLVKKYPKNTFLKIENVKGKLDYHNLFFLRHPDSQKLEIQTLIDEFFKLAVLDSQNLDVMHYFLKAAFYDFENLSLDDLEERLKKISEVLSFYKKGNSENLEFYVTFEEVLKVKIDYVRNNKLSAKKRLTNIILKLSDREFSDLSESHIYYSLFLRCRELGMMIEANNFANKYLNLVNSNISTLNYPVISQRRIIVYSELQMCDKIKPLTTSLVTRGFASQDWANLIEC